MHEVIIGEIKLSKPVHQPW